MTFERIYRLNKWNGVESLSGPGSGDAASRNVARELVDLVRGLDVRSVLDAACGDGYWMPDLPGYVGVDIAPLAIARARARHPDRRYIVGDIATMVRLPRAELVFTRDAMQHLSLAHGAAFLERLRSSGALWLLASTYVGADNVDVRTGGYYTPNLERPPFDLGRPARTIFDGYDYEHGDTIRDPAKYLGLWGL